MKSANWIIGRRKRDLKTSYRISQGSTWNGQKIEVHFNQIIICVFHCSNATRPFWMLLLGPHRLQDITPPGEIWSSVKILITITSARSWERLVSFLQRLFFFITQSLLVPFKSFLLNRAVRSRPAKEMRWLTGITGYSLMGMVRQSWLAVKVRPFGLSIKYIWINVAVPS